jgi:hypothetical protein
MGIFGNDDGGKAARYEQLKQQVTLGLENFRRLGKALGEIRDKELFKIEFTSFEQCCETHWKISKTHAHRLIAAATIAELLEPMGYEVQNERQVRPLRDLEPDDQVAAWSEAQEEGGTADAVERAAAKRRPRTKKFKLAKPIRLRAAGGWVTITPNRKFVNAELTLAEALKLLRHQTRDAA